MDTSPTTIDAATLLELFGYSANDAARASMLSDMCGIEQAARHQMRKHLRVSEFAEVEALANAAAAAQEILNSLHLDK